MVENNKCILAYGLSNIELEYIKNFGCKIIEITPELCKMTVKDILDGKQFSIFNNNPIKEKVIIYNNFAQYDLNEAIRITRGFIKDGILAVVTDESINWEVNYLINHLKEEKEWYMKMRKENSNE